MSSHIVVSTALKDTFVFVLQAVNKYQRLAAVLRGEHPRGMLPPAPRGYVATRLRQLAGTSRFLSAHMTFKLHMCRRVCDACCAGHDRSQRLKQGKGASSVLGTLVAVYARIAHAHLA